MIVKLANKIFNTQAHSRTDTQNKNRKKPRKMNLKKKTIL